MSEESSLKDIFSIFEAGKDVVVKVFDNAQKELESRLGENLQFFDLVLKVKVRYGELVKNMSPEKAFWIAADEEFGHLFRRVNVSQKEKEA